MERINANSEELFQSDTTGLRDILKVNPYKLIDEIHEVGWLRQMLGTKPKVTVGIDMQDEGLAAQRALQFAAEYLRLEKGVQQEDVEIYTNKIIFCDTDMRQRFLYLLNGFGITK